MASGMWVEGMLVPLKFGRYTSGAPGYHFVRPEEGQPQDKIYMDSWEAVNVLNR